MKVLHLFKSCLNSALGTQYLQEKWIGDQSLVTILQDDYGLDFVDNRYMNKYLPDIYLNAYKCYHIRINRIKNKNIKKDKCNFLLLFKTFKLSEIFIDKTTMARGL